LTGLLAGLKAKKKELKEAVLDVGVKKPVKGSRIYAGFMGVLDAGISVPHGEDIFPPIERIRGEHIANYWKTIENPEERERRFSQYLKNGLTPEELPKHFEEVKNNIKNAFPDA